MNLINISCILFIYSVSGSLTLLRNYDSLISQNNSEPQLGLKNKILYEDQQKSKILSEKLYFSVPALVADIVNKDEPKCLTIIIDDDTETSAFLFEIKARTDLPIVLLLLCQELENKLCYNDVEKEENFVKILTESTNYVCNYNIILVKFRSTAIRIAYLLIESSKWSIIRVQNKYIFVPLLQKEKQKEKHVLKTNLHTESRRIFHNKHEINSVIVAQNYSNNKTDKEIATREQSERNRTEKENIHPKIGITIPCQTEHVGVESVFDDMTSILCLKEMDSIPDVIVVRHKPPKTKPEESKFEVITNSFRNRYPDIILQVVCEWNGTDFIPTDCTPFPNKLSNMQGRELRVSTFSLYFPYINMETLDGTENKLMAELSKTLNFSVKINVKKSWGTFHPNGTEAGIHSDLLSGVSDIGIGGIFLMYQNTLHFDFTTTYLINGITMLVPRPRSLPLWLSIVAPFRIWLWLLVVASVLAGFLALDVCALLMRLQRYTSADVNIYTDFKHCLLTVVGQLTQVPANRWPYAAPLRHLLTWQFIFFVLVTTGYKSSLIGFLRYRRYEKTIDSAEDFTNKPNLYWTAVDGSWPKLLASFSDTALQKIHSRYKHFPNVTAINKALHEGNLAIGVENLATGGYSGADYINKDFIASSMWLMTYDLSTTMVGMELRKGSPYAEQFNVIINRLIQAGIVRQWEALCWIYTDPWRKQLGLITTTRFGLTERVLQEPPTKMKLSHLHGVFLLLFVGLCLSFVVFFIEIRWARN